MNDLIITLDDKVREYKELLDKKDELAELTKANTKALSRAKKKHRRNNDGRCENA